MRWTPLAALFLVAFASPGATQDFPKLSGRVVDGANLLTPAAEAALTGKLEALEKASTRQLVVATVPSLQGYEIEDYGYRLGRAWGIGQSEANNGTILLVAPNERKVRIEVGYGLEPILTDALSSLIVNNTILPRFRENDYTGGINAGADAIIQQLQAPPEVAEQRAMEAVAEASQSRASSGDAAGVIGGMLVLGLVLLVIGMSLARRKRRRKGPWGGRRYGGSDWPIILWAVADEMSRSAHHGGGGFGGFGGGGDGGFGGFSGGGGSFGGGGASGSW